MGLAVEPLHTVGQAIHQGFEGACRAIAQAHLQPPSGEEEEDEHGQGVEIDFPAEQALGLKGPQRAHDEGDHHADGHRKVHADATMPHVLPGTLQERPAREQHDGHRDEP